MHHRGFFKSCKRMLVCENSLVQWPPSCRNTTIGCLSLWSQCSNNTCPAPPRRKPSRLGRPQWSPWPSDCSPWRWLRHRPAWQTGFRYNASPPWPTLSTSSSAVTMGCILQECLSKKCNNPSSRWPHSNGTVCNCFVWWSNDASVHSNAH